MNSILRNRKGAGATAVSLISLALILLTSCAQFPGVESASHIEKLKTRIEAAESNDVIVVAHRTCWRNTAENSLAGINRCVELGVDMIEIDVRSSRDGELVLMHDETVDRTTNGTGRVVDLSLRELRELRLRAGGEGERLIEVPIPTLEEALLTAKDRILVNLDIKEALYDQALKIARAVGSQGQVVIKIRVPADDPRLVNATFLGQTYFMPIIRECTEDPARECSKSLSAAAPTYAGYNPVAVEVVNHTDNYLLAGVPAVRELGVRLWVNTLGPRFAAGRSDDKSLTDPDGNWGYLINNGVNMIQTDRPEELIRYLKSRRLRSGR